MLFSIDHVDDIEASRDLKDDLETLQARLDSPIRGQAGGHSFAGKLCGFYVFTMGDSACVSHPEWSQQDAFELCDFLRQEEMYLLADTFGHYEALWEVEKPVPIYCAYSSMERLFGDPQKLTALLEAFRERRLEALDGTRP